MVIITDLNSGQFAIGQIVYPKQFRAAAKDGRFLNITSVMAAPVSPIINIDWTEVQLVDRNGRTMPLRSIDAMVTMLNTDFSIGSVQEKGPEASMLEDPNFSNTLISLMVSNSDFIDEIMVQLIDSNTFMNAIVDNPIFTESLATNDVFTSELIKNTYFLQQIANNTTFISTLCSNKTFQEKVKAFMPTSGGVTN